MRPSAASIDTYFLRCAQFLRSHATTDKMWSIFATIFALAGMTVIRTRALTQASIPVSELSNSTDSLIRLSSSNLAAVEQPTQRQNTTSNVTGYGSLTVECLGKYYGIDLSKDSCIDAIAQIHSTDDALHTYGRRDQKLRYKFNVPQRWISCK